MCQYFSWKLFLQKHSTSNYFSTKLKEEWEDRNLFECCCSEKGVIYPIPCHLQCSIRSSIHRLAVLHSKKWKSNYLKTVLVGFIQARMQMCVLWSVSLCLRGCIQDKIERSRCQRCIGYSQIESIEWVWFVFWFSFV